MQMKLKIITIIVLIVLFCHQSHESSASILSWVCMAFTNYLNSDVRCSVDQMSTKYDEMKSANCRNCDKYFHCQANYNAVYRCNGHQKNIDTAEHISNCREWGDHSADSQADQAANRLGRSGGNCASAYLCANHCSWSPSLGTCSSSNCHHI